MTKWFLLLVVTALAATGWVNRDKISGLLRPQFQPENTPLPLVLALTAPATPHPAAESVAQARKTYPALAVANSSFNKKFVDLYNRTKETNADLLTQADWPMRLAAQTARELTTPVPAVAGPPPTELSGSPLNARPQGSSPAYAVPQSVQLPGLKGSALDQRPSQRVNGAPSSH